MKLIPGQQKFGWRSIRCYPSRILINNLYKLLNNALNFLNKIFLFNIFAIFIKKSKKLDLKA